MSDSSTTEKPAPFSEKMEETTIRRIAADCLPHARLILFGSRARGDQRRRSDYDLAIVPGADFDDRERLSFIEKLDASPAIIHPLDIVDYTDASTDLRNNIDREGIVWKS